MGGLRPFALASLAALAAASSTLPRSVDAACNIASAEPEFVTTIFDHSSFAAVEVKTIFPAVIDETTGALMLAVKEPTGGVPSFMWLLDKYRVANDFAATVDFSIDGDGDGFAFVIQNDRIKNMNGNTARALAFNDIAKSIAVGIHVCPGDGFTCGTPDVRVEVHDAIGDTVTEVAQTLPLSINVTDGAPHTMTLSYTDSTMTVSVSIDDQLMIEEVELTESLESLFGSETATMGFTASTSWDKTADIEITGLKLQQFGSSVTVLEGAASQNVDWGESVNYTIQFSDSCGVALTETPLNITAVIEAKLIRREDNVEVPTPAPFGPYDVIFESTVQSIVGQPDIIDMGDGTVVLQFELPEFQVAKFDLDVVVDATRARGGPYRSVAQSMRPVVVVADGFPLEWLVILIIVLILLCILVIAVVFWLRKYRKKLKDNKEFIEAGLEQARLDKLDEGVTYETNEMIGASADVLRAKLAANNAELAKLKGRQLGDDEEYTLNQLGEHRDKLLHEMNRLKQQEQESSAAKQTFTGMGQGNKRIVKEFGAQQAFD